IEEAVEKANLQCGPRILGQQAYRTGMRELQILDDDARFDDVALAVDQQRKLAQRPALLPLGRVLRCIRPHAAKLERRTVLVQCDEGLLSIGGEGVAVELERHRGALRGNPLALCKWLVEL